MTFLKVPPPGRVCWVWRSAREDRDQPDQQNPASKPCQCIRLLPERRGLYPGDQNQNPCLRQWLVAGEMVGPCGEDPLHQWVPGPILISSHLILETGGLERKPGGRGGGEWFQHCKYRPAWYIQVNLVVSETYVIKGHLVNTYSKSDSHI